MNIEDIQKTVVSLRKSHEKKMQILTDKFLEYVNRELKELPELGLELYKIIYQEEITCPIDLKTGKMGPLISSTEIPNKESCKNFFSSSFENPEVSVIVDYLLDAGCSSVFYDEKEKIYPCIDIDINDEKI